MIKKFNQFINESNFPTSKEEIGLLCKEFNIKNYSINDDLSIDVQGNVSLSGLNLKSLPLRFSRVSGHFYCSNNLLTTLEGGPREVGGGFYCESNPVYEIISIFPDRKMVLKVWGDFGPVRGNIVFDHRLREMYLDITNTDFKGEFKFKNYEINYD